MEDFPDEFNKPLLNSLNMLRQCKIEFFDKNVSFLRKYWCFILSALAVIIHYLSIIFYIARSFTTDISELAFVLPISLGIAQDFLRVAVILPKKKDVAILIIHLGKMWTMNIQNEKKDRLLKRLNFSHAILQRGIIMAAWQNMMTPLIYTLFRKFILHQDTELVLPFACVYPFDPVENWHRYIAMYIFQIYSMLLAVYCHIGMQSLMITFCAHLSIIFALLSENLKHINSRKFNSNSVCRIENERDSDIENFIRKHQHIIRLCDLFNSIYNRIVFIDLLFIILIICFFGFGTMVAHGIVAIVNNFAIVLTVLFPIYILCYFAELLKEESSGLADSAYESLWYKGDRNYQQTIRFIIARSQRPCHLSCLNYTPVTLNTFTKVVSSTWSYISLMRTMYVEN